MCLHMNLTLLCIATMEHKVELRLSNERWQLTYLFIYKIWASWSGYYRRLPVVKKDGIIVIVAILAIVPHEVRIDSPVVDMGKNAHK